MANGVFCTVIKTAMEVKYILLLLHHFHQDRLCGVLEARKGQKELVWKRTAVQLSHSSWAWLKRFGPAQTSDGGTDEDGAAASLPQLPAEYL